MEEKKTEKFFYRMLIIIGMVAVVGTALIIFLNKDDGTVAVFELLAFGLSVSAISFSMLHSIVVARHMRITRHNAGKITEAINKLEELVKEDRQLMKILRDDLELDKLLAMSLKNQTASHSGSSKVKSISEKITKDLKKAKS